MAINEDEPRVNAAVYGLALLVLIYIGRVQEIIPYFNKLYFGKIAFALSILLVVLTSRERYLPVKNVTQVKYVIGIFIFAIVSIPFSYWPGGSLEFILQVFIKTLIFFLLLIGVVKNVAEINIIIWAIACSVLALSISALISGDGSRLSASSTYDPNDLAFVLVTFMPIIYYSMKEKEGISKIVLQVTLIIMVMALLSTASRGGIVGLIVVVAIIIKKQGKNIIQTLLPLTVVLTVVGLFASATFWERMTTMLDPGEDYNMTAGGGRMEIWSKGLKMMLKHPLTGVGINCFEVAEGASHTDIVTGNSGKWSVAHNSFIQIGAELGVIALFLFIMLLTSSIKSIRKCRESNAAGRVPDCFLNGVEVAMYGYISTGFFLSQAYSSVLYLLIAFTVLANTLNRPAPSDFNLITKRY